MDPLSQALSRPEAYPHPTGTIEIVETHISRIFLAGSWAYKLKKAVNLGFLDFTTLPKRKYCCQEELRLNRRLCPDIYHSVVPVVQSGNSFMVGFGETGGNIVDYAVRMVRFDRTMELDRLLSKKLLTRELVEKISGIVARFHKSIPPSPKNSQFGHPDIIIRPVLANFAHTEEITTDSSEVDRLESLKSWTIAEHRRLYEIFLMRKQGGFVRQCHGDMHTGNMVLWKDNVCIFDCIEFNETLSTIDLLSDLAFLFMDLLHGDEPGLAWRLLNTYLFETGDYDALPLLRFYTVYRAMVRAKVTAIRYAQTKGENPDSKILDEHRSYVRLAESCSQERNPMLMITCGVSGSGKTTVSAEISSRLQCLHIRSDIERKRIAGLAPLERSSEERKDSLYSQQSSDETYLRLLEISRIALGEGIPVIVDATFLQEEKRALFLNLAIQMHCPFRIIRCHAPEKELAARVEKRTAEHRDASEADTAVLHRQLESDSGLSGGEIAMTMQIDTSNQVDYAAAARELKSLIS